MPTPHFKFVTQAFWYRIKVQSMTLMMSSGLYFQTPDKETELHVQNRCSAPLIQKLTSLILVKGNQTNANITIQYFCPKEHGKNCRFVLIYLFFYFTSLLSFIYSFIFLPTFASIKCPNNVRAHLSTLI